MDDDMKQLKRSLLELEIEAEHLLLAMRKGSDDQNQCLLAIHIRNEGCWIEADGEGGMCHHDSGESTWLMFLGTDVFATIPSHATHTVLEADQAQLDLEAKKLQSSLKERSYLISERGALADKISPGVLRSLVALTDQEKSKE